MIELYSWKNIQKLEKSQFGDGHFLNQYDKYQFSSSLWRNVDYSIKEIHHKICQLRKNVEKSQSEGQGQAVQARGGCGQAVHAGGGRGQAVQAREGHGQAVHCTGGGKAEAEEGEGGKAPLVQ